MPIMNQDPKVAKMIRLNKLELCITNPKDQEAFDDKHRVLQHEFRDRTKKLNSNLEETVIIAHERTEMAREKIKFAMALLLDDIEQVLQDFDTCPEMNEDKRNKLRVMYRKMLDILNVKRKVSEELLNHEIFNSKNCLVPMVEDVGEECAEKSGSVEDRFVCSKLLKTLRKQREELQKEIQS